MERPTSKRLGTAYSKDLMIASGRASQELAEKVAKQVGVDMVDAGVKTFANGEVYCKFEESVRGADVFIVQSVCDCQANGINTNDALMELLLMVDAAVGASAHRVVAVLPWYGYSRQDKKSAPREPISSRLVAKMLETAGIDRAVSMDLHAGQVQGFFSKPMDHLTAMPVLCDAIQEHYGNGELVIVAPDAGRVKLARKFAKRLNTSYALMEKERPEHNQAKAGYVIGDVEGKTAVIIDDLIDTGGTLSVAAQSVLDHGASSVHAVATHGVFSGNAYENLENSVLDGIIVTDTVPLRAGAPSKIQQVSVSDIFANTILHIFTDESVSDLFAGDNQTF